MDIFVNVSNQKLRVATNQKSLASGTQKFVRFVFNLSPEWDELNVFAQFRQGDAVYNYDLDENNCVYLPIEIVPGSFTLMLCGDKDHVIATSNYVTFVMNDSHFTKDGNSLSVASDTERR